MEKVKIGNYVKQIRGVSYKPNDLHNDLNSDSVILLRANNINEGKINFDDIVYVDKSKVKKEQYLKKGDILVCASSGSKELVGKAAFINKDYAVTFGAFCKLIRPKDCIAGYLGHYFNSQMYKEKISSLALGANINNIRNEHIDELLIYLPNKAEQQNISILLDEVSDLTDKRKKQLEKLDELVKSRFVEMFGDSEFNTMQWPTKKISEICAVSSSKRIYQNELSTEGVPFLRISDLNECIDNAKNVPELFIPINKYNELKENGLVPTEGDILVTSRGTLGRCYIVRPEDEFYFQDGMISWLSDLNSQITSVYLSQLFAMSGIQKQIASLQAGSTVAYLSITMLKKLNIMLPPLDRQEQFAAFVKQTDKSKLEVQKSLEKLEVLKKALMQKYFG